MKRWRFPAVKALLVASVLAWSGCGLLPEERIEELPTLIEPPPSRVVTYPVERGSIAEEITGLARVAPIRESALYFLQSGRIGEIHAALGQTVKEGDVLARLETDTLAHDLEIAEIDYEIAQIQFERTLLEGTPYQISIEERQMKKRTLDIERRRQRLENATLRAPHDGVIRVVRAKVTDEVREYAPIIEMADPSSLQVMMEIRRAEDAAKLTRGQEVHIEVSRDAWAVGHIVQVTDPPGETSSSTFGAKVAYVDLEDSPDRLGLTMGDLVSAKIVVREKEDALIIPRAALREFMGRTYVRLLDGSARREVDVEVGIVTPTHVEIVRGLNEGDLVIGR